MNPEPVGADGATRCWLEPPEPALPYRLLDRLKDAREGRRDGRDGLPKLPEPAADGSPAEPPSLTTPHLTLLRSEQAERVGREELAHEAEMAYHHRRLAACSATTPVLATALQDAGARLDAATKPLAPHEIDERRSAETDPDARPDPLVRSRRLAEHARRLREAQIEFADLQRQLAQNLSEAAAVADLVKRRTAVLRLRIDRIHDHTERRMAVYWRALVREHPRGGELNALLAPQRPTLPGWARDEHDRDRLDDHPDDDQGGTS